MFIGKKSIKEKIELDEKTPGEVSLVQVIFEDGTSERISRLMYDKIVSETQCDDSDLRDKRIFPIVEELLKLLRDWGIKVNELSYMSAVLNRSLDANLKEATNELWSQWMSKPASPDDVDLVTVDRVLRNQKKTLEDVLK